MAATITRNVNFTWNNGATIVGNAVKTSAITANVASVRAFNNTQTIEAGVAIANGETINTIDVTTTADYTLMLTNKSQVSPGVLAVNVYSEYASGSYAHCGRIYPGESWGPVRMPGTTGGYPKIWVWSTTAVDLEVICGEATLA